MSPFHSSPASLSGSYKYDVFLSFRGEDSRNTFVSHFYTALNGRKINTYKDDKSLPRGESIASALFKAIEQSKIAVIIFSENYIASSWCLKELVHIMKCRDERGLTVMPIFYDVEPTKVRNLKRKFENAFPHQETKNSNQVEFSKRLVDASNIAGWEPKKMANGNESEAIQLIVDAIWNKLNELNKLLPLNSYVDKDLVGVEAPVKYLVSKLEMELKPKDVRMVGIWGMGGSGKTTLANSLYREISYYFQGKCAIVENVRENASEYGLKKLQKDMLSDILNEKVSVKSVENGKHTIPSHLHDKRVLLLLDDIDQSDQLEALAGKHCWFGEGSRIIITTRYKHLVKMVDVIYPMRLLSPDDAVELFNKCARNEKKPIEDYEKLSSRVVTYAARLPLALKVLGSFLYDKEKEVWIDTLAKLKDIPERKIVEKLKISYDGLEPMEKELFLDIACFYRRKMKGQAMEILEACGFHPVTGIEVLRQKGLVSIVNGRFDMHDLIQEMGQYIVRERHPNNPEKHNRVWKYEEIKGMWLRDATMIKENVNIEAITYKGYLNNNHPRFCKIVSNMKKLRGLTVYMCDGEWMLNKHEEPNFHSDKLRYIDWDGYHASPFTDSFQPVNLGLLKLNRSMQQELWKGYKYLPKLKVLQLSNMKKLHSTPDFDGLPGLQKLTLFNCEGLQTIHPSDKESTSLEYLRIAACCNLSMPKFVLMRNLKTLELEDCGLGDGESLSDIGKLSNLQELNLSGNNFSWLDFSLSKLTRLKLLNLSSCEHLLELPELPSNLVVLNAYKCKSLTTIGDCHNKCKWLHQVSLTGGGINDGYDLLKSMLMGNAIENHSMVLLLQGLEVAKRLIPWPPNGNGFTLQLPVNWAYDFTGFLMCAVFPNKFYWRDRVAISMKQVISYMESEKGEVEKESWKGEFTWLGYVSFSSLRDTAWWNQTHKAVSFNIEGKYGKYCGGLGVILVEKSLSKGPTDTSSDYRPFFKIEHDSASALSIFLSLYDPGA